MSFLLQHNSGRGWVSKPGHPSSYTRSLRNARKFRSAEEAEGHRCVLSEHIVDLERVLDEARH